ncbi:metallophosphoesterase [Magnetospirillum sp. SS-4]|uniref:metallophosphoesterase n=1 Tax=Magnetospirillum sp. SS-4 TaxID=2681465 RepID=UPI00138135FE|nr:metallophosphoesterase [Magnetospirillum sp. SS-4]CAA7617898.1 putative Metallophosphoesterase [Magnetospirillum sp. SS-4]
MVRLAVMSDLHVEKGDWTPPAFSCDLLVLAGDVGWGLDGLAWVARHLAGRPMVMVAGNREYWHHADGASPIAELRRAAAGIAGLRFLQDEAAVLDLGGRRLRLLGATLWTDYSLDGDVAATMASAGQTMPDYRHGAAGNGERLNPAAVLTANRASRDFLAAELAKPLDIPTVVVTHHLPSERGLPRRRPGHVPQAASVTPLDDLLIEAGPDLWIHGHSHADCDYRIGRTRVVSRQRGTPENSDFEPLLLDI